MRIRNLLCGLLALFPLAAFAEPEVGAPAPDFAFAGVDGASYKLADYVGPDVDQRGVVIAWFPKAFTAG